MFGAPSIVSVVAVCSEHQANHVPAQSATAGRIATVFCFRALILIKFGVERRRKFEGICPEV